MVWNMGFLALHPGVQLSLFEKRFFLEEICPNELWWWRGTLGQAKPP